MWRLTPFVASTCQISPYSVVNTTSLMPPVPILSTPTAPPGIAVSGGAPPARPTPVTGKFIVFVHTERPVSMSIAATKLPTPELPPLLVWTNA